MIRAIIAIFTIIFGLNACLAAEQLDVATERKTTGIYSDMRFIPESGDVAGVEIYLLRSSNGFFVLFQDAEGVPRTPSLVHAEVHGEHIEFVLPERSGYTGKFTGIISKHNLVGGFSNGQVDSRGEIEFQLKRGSGYWAGN